MVRWFRNTMKGSGLEFGCELLSDNPEAAAAAPRTRRRARWRRSSCCPRTAPGGAEDAPPQIIVPAGVVRARAGASRCSAASETGFAVLTKLVEQGPGFELYEFVAVP